MRVVFSKLAKLDIPDLIIPPPSDDKPKPAVLVGQHVAPHLMHHKRGWIVQADGPATGSIVDAKGKVIIGFEVAP